MDISQSQSLAVRALEDALRKAKGERLTGHLCLTVQMQDGQPQRMSVERKEWFGFSPSQK